MEELEYETSRLGTNAVKYSALEEQLVETFYKLKDVAKDNYVDILNKNTSLFNFVNYFLISCPSDEQLELFSITTSAVSPT